MCESHDHNDKAFTRRAMLGGAAVSLAAAGIAATSVGNVSHAASSNPNYDDPVKPALPPVDVEISVNDTALIVVDPQIDFLSDKGVTWGVVGESVTEHNVVKNIGNLLNSAKKAGMVVAISPHYYYPTDHGWKFEGPLEKLMHKIGMFNRKGSLNLDGFDNSGADFMPEYKDQILDGKTIIASPHKIYGPQNNDLALQLRKNGISKVILSGMSANLCVQAHLYDLLEQGFEVAVVRDATAAAKLPEGDGYHAALINFRYVANALWTTEETVKRIGAAAS
ncbi:cysteine hydrolase [Kiloniella antarctica]|uniref:Cysteine hydrolase n=1 Tax=Kiloniella antarctica TaxID=1550907 RepID=A0ABW5BSA5_9PROT